MRGRVRAGINKKRRAKNNRCNNQPAYMQGCGDHGDVLVLLAHLKEEGEKILKRGGRAQTH